MTKLDISSQEGSVTLFVLIAVLFFSIILLGVYNKNMNNLQTQSSDVARIQEAYDKNANELYEQTVQKFENENWFYNNV